MTQIYIELSLVYFVLLFTLWNGAFQVVEQSKLTTLTDRVMGLVPSQLNSKS
jgi:hypothetical protein